MAYDYTGQKKIRDGRGYYWTTESNSTADEYDRTGQYALRKIGAYHMIGDDEYEPQRNNNFEIHIFGLGNLKYVDSKANVDQSEAQSCLTLSAVSVGALSQSITPIEVPYGNTKVKFAGLPSVGDSEIVYTDYIGKNTERIINAWHGLVFNPRTEKIGRASEYKKPAILIETAPDGSCSRVWNLKGCWPSTVNYGAYDYNGGAVRQINLTLTYDIMIPIDDANEKVQIINRMADYRVG